VVFVLPFKSRQIFKNNPFNQILSIMLHRVLQNAPHHARKVLQQTRLAGFATQSADASKSAVNTPWVSEDELMALLSQNVDCEQSDTVCSGVLIIFACL
jgi:hypothetical protein